MMIYKVCSKCKLRLPATAQYFYRDGNHFRSECKACKSVASRLYYQEHREQINQYNKQTYHRRKFAKLAAAKTDRVIVKLPEIG